MAEPATTATAEAMDNIKEPIPIAANPTAPDAPTLGSHAPEIAGAPGEAVAPEEEKVVRIASCIYRY
ncbi:MAG: hypothetical protein FWH33_05175 [Oscillospiraceae bacterium]|nr:hypothetical protein [Oscillospiraceae bacterium]